MAKSILERIQTFETVIWDWNGTLINDASIAIHTEHQLFMRHGVLIPTPEERAKKFCFPIEQYYKNVGFDFSKVSFDRLSKEWLQIYEGLVMKAPLFEGVREMIEDLKKGGRRQFVLSAAPEDHVQTMATHHDIHHYFDGIYGLPHAKADSKIERGRELIRDHQVNPLTTIIVGNTGHDFEVGKALGTTVLLIADGHHAYEALTDLHDNVMKSRFSV